MIINNYKLVAKNVISCFARNLIKIVQIFPNRIIHIYKSWECDNTTT
jgi:hypothetical protein